ncbi:alpha/beta hydrolase [uncultured Cohaesibacter sp.]|uniref:alpha/beta hydrolase n=1 Tax=uncultured Cohaesibacter sp. TaxID=1002546 RepID=UPI0029C687AF|nr:alpha/beta hydrolase [uncultured Cohaesibacter sp.]
MSTSASSHALRLSSYKDRLFRYPDVLESRYGGDLVRVDYKAQRDINDRDELPVKKVKSYYISFKPNSSQATFDYSVNGRALKYEAVGKTAGGADIIVVYLHGKGGNRHQGVDDWSFGGNFNRIKNLMVRNNGLYISPDFSDFGDRGGQEIKALIASQKARSPGAAVFVACGSMGGEICWQILADANAASMVDGLLLLGVARNDTLFSSAAFQSTGASIPLFIGHGTWDSAFPWKGQLDFFETVKTLKPTYPIRLAIFETGKHGTPIRMLDWRDTLNWMLSLKN